MMNVKEGVEIMGNVIYFYCFYLDVMMCFLIKMVGIIFGVIC